MLDVMAMSGAPVVYDEVLLSIGDGVCQEQERMTAKTTGRVLGVGGVFFRSPDARRDSRAGTGKRSGLEIEAWGATHGTSFSPDAMPANSFTVWSTFACGHRVFWRPPPVIHDQPGGGRPGRSALANERRRCRWHSHSGKGGRLTSAALAGSWIRTAIVLSCGSRRRKCRYQVSSERLR